MSASPERVADALRTSLKEAERLRRENRRLRYAAGEPIAIVGMSCRYPGGANSPEELWDLLAAGADAISEFPIDRDWDVDRLFSSDPDQPGTTYSCEGGFVDGMADFDPGFFGISPREALLMDPQERLLLEASWTALEAAGITSTAVRGTLTGVFAGVMYHDYARGLRSPGSEFGDFLATGGSASLSSGRVAYTLGLEGPTMTVDTACSSSLVALHLAAQALRGGECNLALAGGVTALSTPEIFTQFSRQRGLASDGRCKSFAEAADGTGFSEGAGVLVLERLSDAEANGHPVLATIRGSAVNQDGASNGITAPNGPSQERVIRQALANAGLTPQDVDAVEAHGTGTTLGDPIEAGALLATYGQERDEPLRLGSLKSNIGHSQAAAGVAGVIKAVLAMQNGALPKTLHVDAPSSKVDWPAGKIELLTEQVPWEANGRPRRAAVSSFGASGTNAHMILEEGSAPKPAPVGGEGKGEGGESLPPLPFVLSAKSEPALAEAAARLAFHVEANPELALADLGYSLATTRTRFEHRAVALAEDRENLLDSLAAIAERADAPHAARARARGDARPVFLFSGQGSQWLGMGVELAEASPAFASHLRSSEEALFPHLKWSVRDVLHAADGAPSIDRIEVVQPVLFAISVSLAKLWGECGVQPAAVLGHSQGEIAAAHIAGGLSLEDAAMLAAVRSRIISKLAGKGAMVSVALPVGELDSRLPAWEGEIEIAAQNSPSSTLLSAGREAADGFLRQCEEEGVRAREIPATIASHSSRVEPLRDELLEALASISPQEGDVPFHSTVSGEPLDTRELDASYWYRNLREPVLLEPVLRSLLAGGHRCFVEVGPHPVLAFGAQETIEDALGDPDRAAVLSTLRRGEGGPERFALSMAEAHAAGVELDWEALFADTGAKPVHLPTYPFQRKRYWLSALDGAGDLGAAGLTRADHPLLSASIEQPDGGGLAFTGRLSNSSHPWLGDHGLAGTILLPGTAFLELALRAGAEAELEVLEELTLQAPLILAERSAVRIQVLLGEPGGDGSREVSIHSRPDGDGDEEPTGEPEWTCHARGTLSSRQPEGPRFPADWPPEGAEPIEVADLYEDLAELGFEYGPSFRGLAAAWRKGEAIYADVSLPPEQVEAASGFVLHPALLDAAGHAGLAVALGAGGGNGGGPRKAALPFAWGGVRVFSPGASSLRVCLNLAEGGGTLTAFDEVGAAVAAIESVAMRPVDRDLLGAASRRRLPLHRVGWVEAGLSAAADSELPRLAVLGEEPIEGVEGEPAPSLPALAEAIAAGAEPPDAVVARVPQECDRKSGVVEAAHATASDTLALLQAWVAEESFAHSRLCLLVERAVSVSETEAPDLAAAPLVGLLRSACSEHPGRFALIDSDDSEASRGMLAAAAAATAEEPQIALREGAGLVPRMARVQAPEEKAAAVGIDPVATVLITGGTSGIGALVARHLVAEHGIRHLLLVSRSGAEADGAAELAAALEEMGAEPTFAACDVSDRGQLEDLLDSIPPERPLGAIFHAAGVLDDGLLESLDPERLASVMGPKADAAWHLHELTEGAELTAFVLFSSVMGILGGAAQANYAAANAYLDALAAHRRARGLPAISLAWGGWALQSSMIDAAEDREDLARIAQQIRARHGLVPMSVEQGLESLDASLALAEPLLAPVAFDRSVLRAQVSAGTLPAVLRGMVPTSAQRQAAGASLADRIAGVPEAEQADVVLELVRGHVAAVLGHASAADVEPDRAFKDLGFDSLAAVELRNRLVAATGLRIAPTVVFDYPSTAALAEFLHGEARGKAKSVASVARSGVASDEPIAIVGMSCRYPGGASSPDQLWRLVAAGRDAISEFPADRGWDLDRIYDPEPGKLGTSYAREGGFLADAAEFDPAFFGISPREAAFMDPQERSLLEASWEALENGGVNPHTLRGSRTGVFAGVMYQDYGSIEYGVSPGMTSSGVSGRVSYTLGLEGPAITVDTACSSSLVAMHLAGQALRGGECDLALAGGVTVLATPGIFLFFSLQRALAPDGRCKPFAEAADGTAISEGLGMVLLERLSDARASGHPVLATIRGSAVNQDGASNGLTAPNGPSQERVIRQALANAGLTPQDIDAVEAHGTGTTLGDPIEAGALLATYGQDREQPLKLGSLKSNIGHTQAAAGVGGVIKTVLAMQRGLLPKTLHVDSPSSKVDWEAGQIELLTEAVPWESNGRPRRAAVSSFGASGTNAHMVLEEAAATAADRPDQPLPGPVPLCLSAKSEPALRELADRLAARFAADPDLRPVDAAYSLAVGRAALDHRAVVLGSDRSELLDGLAALRNGDPAAGLVQGAARRGGKLAYLFTGQGSQRPGMGRQLHASYPAFASAFDDVCGHLDADLDAPLAELVFADGEEAARLLSDTSFAQPALFATEVALFRLLESLGLAPDLLAGHSIGELSAAHVAGVLSLPDAAALVAARGKLMGALPRGGAMLAVQATETEASESLEGEEASLSIAAINSLESVVISGEEGTIARAQERWEAAGRKTKRLAVSHAFHSPLIEPMLAEFEEIATSLDYGEPAVPIVSNLTGEVLTAEQAADPSYWVRQARAPVRFVDSVATLREKGASAFLELGPDAVLSAMARECLPEEGANDEGPVLEAVLREGRPEPWTLARALASVQVRGRTVDWAALLEDAGPRLVALPSYPFQRKRYWLDSGAARPGDPGSAGQEPAEHPLLSASIVLAGGEGRLLTGRLSPRSQAWLADHVLAGATLLPGTAFVELALRAGQSVGAASLEELALQAPLVFSEREAVQLQVAVEGPDEDGRREISIHSRPEDRGDDLGEAPDWTCHARGILAPQGSAAPEPLTTWPPEGGEPLEVEGLYERLADMGVELGPAFHGVRAAWRRGDELFVEVALPEGQADQAQRFGLHPALLDSVGHVGVDLALSAGAAGEGADLHLPFAWHGVDLFAPGAGALRARVSLGEGGGGLVAFDQAGDPVVAVDSLALRPIDPSMLAAASARRQPLYRLRWIDPEPSSAAQPGESGRAILAEDGIEGLDGERFDDLAALVAAIDGGTPVPAVVLADLRAGKGEQEPLVEARAATGEALSLVQAWIAEEKLERARLCILTGGAVSAEPDEAPELRTAPLWGLLRSAQSEHPDRFALLDTDDSPASSRELAAALAIGAEEPQVALRNGVALVPRLTRFEAEEGEAASGSISAGSTVLVTGGTSGLGALVARHLASEHGVSRLLLVSRSGEEAEGAGELREELEALGADVAIAACDAADRSQLEALLDSIPAEHPLGAVVHSAGVLDDGVLASLDAERLDRVMRPKMDAAWHLHRLTEGMELSQFVLFSSAAGVLGTPGQANYAAANAFLDALAARRRAQGLPALSLAWGGWAQQGGMTGALSKADLARAARLGIAPIEPDQGLELFDLARVTDESCLVPIGLERSALRAQASAGAMPAVLRGLVRAPSGSRRKARSLADRLAGVPEPERLGTVLELVRTHVAAVLGHASSEAVEPESPFSELGFDSLAAVELRNRLNAATGLRLPPTLVFDYPSAAEVASHLLSLVDPGSGEEAVEDETDGAERSAAAAAVDAEQLAAMSDEEIFELIDNEVGSAEGGD